MFVIFQAQPLTIEEADVQEAIRIEVKFGNKMFHVENETDAYQAWLALVLEHEVSLTPRMARSVLKSFKDSKLETARDCGTMVQKLRKQYGFCNHPMRKQWHIAPTPRSRYKLGDMVHFPKLHDTLNNLV